MALLGMVFRGAAALISAFVAAAALSSCAHAQVAQNREARMAPAEQYLSASRDAEIALARTAAPASISDGASVLVLSRDGYEVAVEGSNGFVCLVERSWANNFDHPEYWNTRVRSPDCYNETAARSVLPRYLTRTEWVLAGVSRAEMARRTQDAIARGDFALPEVGSMSFMMSKQGYLGDDAGGPWRSHVMFFLPRTDASAWGANLPGSPVVGSASSVEPVTVFFVPVMHWSDGTPSP